VARERLDAHAAGARLSAVQTRRLHHQETALRSVLGDLAQATATRRSRTSARGFAESSRPRRALRHFRPLFRQCRGQLAGAQLVDRGLFGRYVEKATQSSYAGDGRTYDYEGTNREKLLADDEDDVASPSTGYLWDLAARKGISISRLRASSCGDPTTSTLRERVTSR